MNEISKVLLLGTVPAENLFGESTTVVGRIVELRHFVVSTERFDCSTCECCFELQVGSLECPVCGDAVKPVESDVRERRLLEICLFEQSGGKIYLYGTEKYTVGACYCLNIAGNVVLGCATQDIPLLVKQFSVHDIISFILKQAENTLSFALPNVLDNQKLELETLSFRAILTVFCHLKTVIVSKNSYLLAQQFVEKLLGLLEQNTNAVVLSNLSKQLSLKEDALQFTELRPEIIFYLPSAIYTSQTRVVDNLFQQNFSLQIALEGAIYKVEYDYPVIVVNSKSALEGALQFSYNEMKLRLESPEVNVRSLGQLVKMYSFQRIPIELSNPYEIQLQERFKLPSDAYQQFCSGIIRLLGVELIDSTVAKVANVAMLMFQKGVSKAEEFIREVEEW